MRLEPRAPSCRVDAVPRQRQPARWSARPKRRTTRSPARHRRGCRRGRWRSRSGRAAPDRNRGRRGTGSRASRPRPAAPPEAPAAPGFRPRPGFRLRPGFRPRPRPPAPGHTAPPAASVAVAAPSDTPASACGGAAASTVAAGVAAKRGVGGDAGRRRERLPGAVALELGQTGEVPASTSVTPLLLPPLSTSAARSAALTICPLGSATTAMRSHDG